MSVQFDAVATDRHLLLFKLTQLQNALPEKEVYSWAFFQARLQQLFLEAELMDCNNELAKSKFSRTF